MKNYFYVALVALNFSVSAQAMTKCSGLNGDTTATIMMFTHGTVGFVQDGAVVISTRGNPNGIAYTLNHEDISQFFESTSEDGRRAFVGLSAYVNHENPVSIRYAGQNIEIGLDVALHIPSRPKEPDCEMRVWKGPGFPAEQQIQFRNVVCEVTLIP